MATTQDAPHRPAAVAFARRLEKQYADAVDTVLLYGSVARDDACGLDSDVDLLVVLNKTVDEHRYGRLIRDLAYDIELEYGVVLSVLVTSASDYGAGSPFLEHVHRDGEALYG